VLQVAAMTPCKLCYGVEKAETPAMYSEVIIGFLCVTLFETCAYLLQGFNNYITVEAFVVELLSVKSRALCGLWELWFFVRIGPICFLSGCRKRLLNQG